MFALKNIEAVNQKALELVQSLSLEAINQTPQGFNNNIAWNFGHIATTCYSLAFKATGVDMNFPIPLAAKYGKGSKPEEVTTPEELEQLTQLLQNFPAIIQQAMEENKFETVKEYTTLTFGVPITNIAEMLTTIALHHTLHWQTMKDIKNILNHKS